MFERKRKKIKKQGLNDNIVGVNVILYLKRKATNSHKTFPLAISENLCRMKFLKDKNVCIRSILIRKLPVPKRGRRIIPAHLIKILLYFEVTSISGKRDWTTRSFFNYFMGYCDADGTLTNRRLLIWKFSNLHVNLIFPFFFFFLSIVIALVRCKLQKLNCSRVFAR